jgi:putative copper export protein
MQNNLIVFIHLLAAGVAFGSLLYATLLLLPRGKQDDAAPEQSTRYRALEVLAPTVFVSLLVLLASGIYFLFANYTGQNNFTDGYYNLFGIKMLFVIAAIFLSIYQTFTLKGRISNLDLSPENRKLVPATLDQMETVGKIALGVIAAAAFLGVSLARF